jgi:hypothetical protein
VKRAVSTFSPILQFTSSFDVSTLASIATITPVSISASIFVSANKLYLSYPTASALTYALPVIYLMNSVSIISITDDDQISQAMYLLRYRSNLAEYSIDFVV